MKNISQNNKHAARFIRISKSSSKRLTSFRNQFLLTDKFVFQRVIEKKQWKLIEFVFQNDLSHKLKEFPNSLLHSCCENNRIDLLRLLLKEKRIDLNFNDCVSLRILVKNKFMEAANILVDDLRLDLKICGLEVLKWVTFHYEFDFLKKLLDDDRLNFWSNLLMCEHVLRICSWKDFREIMHFILNHKQFRWESLEFKNSSDVTLLCPEVAHATGNRTIMKYLARFQSNPLYLDVWKMRWVDI